MVLGLVGWQVYLFFALVFFFLTVGGLVTFIILSRMRWPFKVVILENLAGQGYTISKRDKARLISFGDGGEEIFVLKKQKKYKIGYGKRIGKNQIAWAIGQDGYWYNFTFGDLDDKLLELGVMPVDRDMRFATASVRKGIENRYNDRSWMDKYGTILYFGLFIITLIIFGVIMYMAFNKQVEIAKTNAEAIKTSKEVMDVAKQVLSNIDTIKSGGGSGLVTA